VEKPMPQLLAAVNDSVRVLLPDDGRSFELLRAPVVSLCYIGTDDSIYWIDHTRHLVAANVASNGTVLQVTTAAHLSAVGNENMPKIIINDTINLCFFKTAINILVISNHNSFRVLLDKIASMYFI